MEMGKENQWGEHMRERERERERGNDGRMSKAGLGPT